MPLSISPASAAWPWAEVALPPPRPPHASSAARSHSSAFSPLCSEKMSTQKDRQGSVTTNVLYTYVHSLWAPPLYCRAAWHASVFGKMKRAFIGRTCAAGVFFKRRKRNMYYSIHTSNVQRSETIDLLHCTAGGGPAPPSLRPRLGRQLVVVEGRGQWRRRQKQRWS